MFGITEAFDVWRLANHVPRWVWKMQEKAGLNDMQVRYIERAADEWDGYQADIQRGLDSMRKDYPFDIWKFDTDDEIIAHLSKLIDEANGDYEQLAKDDVDYPTRKVVMMLRDVDGMNKLRRKIRARQIHKTQPDSMQLTEYEIVRAREFPLERLLQEQGVEINRANKILCPFHDDRNPSMWVKNGWGYCHSCGESCDSIKWLMKIRGVRFYDAVRSLQ